MKLIRQRGLINGLLFLLIPLFLLNIRPGDFLYAQDQLSSNLSPEIAINQYDFSQSLRVLIIDSYIADSLLTEFEYKVLKLDIIFNTKTNPSNIEQQLKTLISKDDLLSYFTENGASQQKIAATRLKVRKIFHAILEQYGYEPFTLGAYQDKIIEKLLAEHNKYLARSGDYVLVSRIWQTIGSLTADEILRFVVQPSSVAEHALKKKVILLLSADLRDDGIVLDQKVWQLIEQSIEEKKQNILSYFYFNTQKYDQELKQRLMSNFSMRSIAYYHADTAVYAYERQKIRKRMYIFYINWLKELDIRIKQNPHITKRYVYNEGALWHSRYVAALDKVVREMLEIDAGSYDLSVKKMLGQKIAKNDISKIKSALDLIVDAENKLLSQKPANFDLYHRIRAINTSYISNFAYIDDVPVLYIDDGIVGRQVFAADELYFIEQGSAVLYKTINSKTGENEIFIFSQQFPFVQVQKMKNDYAKIFRENLKAFIAAKFSSAQVREFLDYSSGTPSDWQNAYTLSEQVNNACEQFFGEKFNLKLNKDSWRIIIEVMNEYADGKHTLTRAETEFVNMALPFIPVNGIMRLTGRVYGVFSLPRGQLFQMQTNQLILGQSI